MKSSSTLDVPIEAPVEIKKKIAKKLQKSGALKRIERKIKLGMMVAIEELQDDPKGNGNLERKKFKNASVYEQRALQVVFNFLADHNMTYTLSALLEESCSKRNMNDTSDIFDYIDTSKPLPLRDQMSFQSDIVSNDSETNIDRLIDSELSSDPNSPQRKNLYKKRK